MGVGTTMIMMEVVNRQWYVPSERLFHLTPKTVTDYKLIIIVTILMYVLLYLYHVMLLC